MLVPVVFLRKTETEAKRSKCVTKALTPKQQSHKGFTIVTFHYLRQEMFLMTNSTEDEQIFRSVLKWERTELGQTYTQETQ